MTCSVQGKNTILRLCVANAHNGFNRMDIHESKDANTVTATFELPSLKPDDIAIDVHQDRLTVAGEAKKTHSHEEGGYAVRERSYGKFSRTLQLPFATKVSISCHCSTCGCSRNA